MLKDRRTTTKVPAHSREELGNTARLKGIPPRFAFIPDIEFSWIFFCLFVCFGFCFVVFPGLGLVWLVLVLFFETGSQVALAVLKLVI